MAQFSQELCEELAKNARQIGTPGKGILAADESGGTIKKRFDQIGVESTETTRREYRTLLFSAPDLGKYISGAILYEETLMQDSTIGGKTMVDLLNDQKVMVGIKVDKGVVVLPGTDDEKATCGLDGLADRCKEYYKRGARFAKWRAVLTIDERGQKPSPVSIEETACTLARYAHICQSERLVPIIEPEILSDGDHSIETCARVTEEVLSAVFRKCKIYGVLLEGALLKPNMVTAGSDAGVKASPADVGMYTRRTLLRTVPPALPCVCFLSGGQSEEEASINLNACNQGYSNPWQLTFSYGRALQASVLKEWKGQTANIPSAQKILMQRAEANSKAQLGKYAGGAGGSDAKADLFEKKYAY